MTTHGFSAMASTLLNASGSWTSDAIERQLAHIDANAGSMSEASIGMSAFG